MVFTDGVACIVSKYMHIVDLGLLYTSLVHIVYTHGQKLCWSVEEADRCEKSSTKLLPANTATPGLASVTHWRNIGSESPHSSTSHVHKLIKKMSLYLVHFFHVIIILKCDGYRHSSLGNIYFAKEPISLIERSL